MKFRELKNKDFFWWSIAFVAGALVWSIPSYLHAVGVGEGPMILTAVLILFSVGVTIKYFKELNSWKLALASILALPVIELVSIVLFPNESAGSISVLHSLPYLFFKLPIYALQGFPVLIGAHLSPYFLKQDTKASGINGWLRKNWSLLLDFFPGFLAGLIYNLTSPKVPTKTFPVFLVTLMVLILLGSAFAISYFLPKKVRQCALIMAFGLVTAVVFRIFIDMIGDATSHNLFPFEIIISLIISLPLTFAGAYIGLLVNFLVLKFKNKQVKG